MMAVFVGAVRKLLKHRRLLLDCLLHGQEGEQGLKHYREGLRLAVFDLPGRQSSMHVEELLVPTVMLYLPFAGHLAACIFVMAVLKEQF